MSRNRAALLAWSSTPQHARQRFVLRGYRRRPFSMSVAFFTLHNETANIWTHVMAFGWALIRIHDTAQDSAVAGDARASMRVLHSFAAFAFCASAVAHAVGPMLPRAASARVWRLDMFGICAFGAGSFIPGIRFGFRCRPTWQLAYTSLVVVCAGISLASLMWGRAGSGGRVLVPQGFVVSMIVMCTFGLIQLLHWCSFAEPAERTELLPGVLGMFVCYAVGFAFWKLCPLERLWPGGIFDFCGSHLVWHLSTLAAIALWDGTCRRTLHRPWDGSDCR